MSGPKKVFLVVNHKRIEKFEYLKDIVELVLLSNSFIFTDPGTLGLLREAGVTSYSIGEIEPRQLDGKKIDFALVLGGDGTILSTARIVCEHGIPILGINLGHLGFLAEVMPAEYKNSISRIFHGGGFTVEKRMMLECKIERDGKPIASFCALNEAVIRRESDAKMNVLEIFIDGKFVDKYCGDGLIISTPTGSTAYSLSCGGPILAPTVPAFLMIPICAFTLASRPLIVPDSVRIEVHERSEWKSTITFDGQHSFALAPGDVIRCSKAPFDAGLIKFEENNFFDILRTKLNWGNYKRI